MNAILNFDYYPLFFIDPNATQIAKESGIPYFQAASSTVNDMEKMLSLLESNEKFIIVHDASCDVKEQNGITYYVDLTYINLIDRFLPKIKESVFLLFYRNIIA